MDTNFKQFLQDGQVYVPEMNDSKINLIPHMGEVFSLKIGFNKHQRIMGLGHNFNISNFITKVERLTIKITS